jgi:hypothetical protein
VWPTFCQSASQNVPIPLSGKLKVTLSGLLCLLQKGMQDVDSFFEPCQVEDPMLHASVYPQFLDTGANAGHGLPVIRLKPLLNQMQLMAGKASGSLWESSQVLKGGAYPEELLHGRPALYNFLYTAAIPGGGTATTSTV